MASNNTSSEANKPLARQQRPQHRQAPSLFVGPPSRDASAIDITKSQEPASKRIPLTRQRSATAGQAENSSLNAPRLQPNFSGEGGRLAVPGASSIDRTDAVWAEMQNTLEEVELNAAGGANVFSRDHARALEELRKAQIELAQAWTRSEGEDDPLQPNQGQLHGELERSGVLSSERAAALNKSTNTDSRRGSAQPEKSQLERETENDIMLARQRRQANDRYFESVNKGVVDVVEKLQAVAAKMRDVEDESQSVWSDRRSSSLDSTSVR